MAIRYADDLGGGIRAPRRGRAVPERVWGTAGEVRTGTAPGEDANDRVRTKRRKGTRGAGGRETGELHVSGVRPYLWNHQTGLFHDPKTNGEEATGGETADHQADAAQSHARAGTDDRGVVGACAERALPILRRTGKLGEFGAVSGEDRPLLGPGSRPALTNWESLCHPTRSAFHSLVTSAQGGASLPGAALCRYPSKVRAVCVNRARTDPCGGCEATRIPTATSPLVVCHVRKTTMAFRRGLGTHDRDPAPE